MTDPATRRLGITTQTMLLVTAIATIAILVAGLAAYPFVRAAAESQAQGELASLADVTAAYADRRIDVRERFLPRPLARILGREEISGYVVGFGATEVPEVPQDMVSRALAGDSVSERARTDSGATILIEGRPIQQGAVLLVQPLTAASAATEVFVVRIVGALLLGLLIAVAIGFVVARRMSRPLRAAQTVAHRMAAGSREEKLPSQGPAEVADIAEALNALNAALIVSERRQREFLLSVSHELRTPLTAVRGYGEALSDGLVSDADLPDIGRTIAAESTRLNRLVNDLLDLARMGAVDFHVSVSEIDLSELVQDAGRVWTDRCIREGVGFAVRGVDEPTMVVADAMRVRQVLDNLLENALRVSPRASDISVIVHRNGDLAGGSFAVIEVRDAGPGLSADDVAVAFEPGALHERYRGERPVGTGLGLALVARLCEAMGGSAAVTSDSRTGTSFWVRLPSAQS